MTPSLRVRMYQVGFGDCFLLSLPDNKTILVDCGFHSQGKGAFSGNEIAEQVIADLNDTTGKPHIDVVIATHRHRDHVFSFNSALWDHVDVGEVWMPWVENRENENATRLWRRQFAFAQQLAAALPNFSLSDDDKKSAQFMLWNAGVDVPGFALHEAWSNSTALDRLIAGFRSRELEQPRYLPATKTFPESFETPILPGVRVHVLGPSRDPELLVKLDPESDGETYRALTLRAADAAGVSVEPPFSSAWEVQTADPPSLDADEIARLQSLARNADPLFAAQALDDMINSTSLVLILQIGAARLLLPGDAEWGTWKTILENERARALLRGVTFIKIGHHGSHNATSKSLVELLPNGIPAMIPTQEGKGTYRNDIPLPDLIAALQGRGIRAVRSDKLGEAIPDGFTLGPDGKWVDAIVPC